MFHKHASKTAKLSMTSSKYFSHLGAYATVVTI